MEEQQAKSKWDELARQIGADIPSEPEQPPALQPAAPSIAIDSASVAAVAQLAPLRRPAAGWDSLASEFGLPTPAPAAPPEVETANIVPAAGRAATPEVVASTSESEATQRRGRRDSGSRGRRDEREPQRREGTRERRDERSRERGDADAPKRREERPRDRSRQRGEPRRGRPAPRTAAETSKSDDSVTPLPAAEEFAVEPVSMPLAQEVPPATEPAKPAAISLWHKIFGLPADHASLQGATAATPTVVGESAPPPSESRSVARDDAEDLVDDVARVEEDEIDSEPQVADERAGDSADVELQRQGRRRRRGRGGRGRRGSSESSEPRTRERRSRKATSAERGDRREDEAAADEDEFAEMEEIAADDEFADSLDRSADDEGDEDSAEADQFASGRGKLALQRSIPSWEEAIGFIVETNMQNRSQRRPSGPTGSRASSPRGRSRGRRKN